MSRFRFGCDRWALEGDRQIGPCRFRPLFSLGTKRILKKSFGCHPPGFFPGWVFYFGKKLLKSCVQIVTTRIHVHYETVKPFFGQLKRDTNETYMRRNGVHHDMPGHDALFSYVVFQNAEGLKDALYRYDQGADQL
mgnify:CR=1 FL=1